MLFEEKDMKLQNIMRTQDNSLVQIVYKFECFQHPDSFNKYCWIREDQSRWRVKLLQHLAI